MRASSRPDRRPAANALFVERRLGLLLVEDGIGKRDYSVVQGCVLAISTTYIIANTLTDMIYRWLDPRIRVS